MQNKIDAVLTNADRDEVLAKLQEIRGTLNFLIDLTPEDRKTLFKMGESGRPFVEASLSLVEQDDTFMPRSFNKTEMRQDNALYESLFPIYILLSQISDSVEDTIMLVGSDLIVAGLDVYKNAKENGTGNNLDDLVPLLGRRFKRNAKSKDDEANENPS